jgi:hypothetical protein
MKREIEEEEEERYKIFIPKIKSLINILSLILSSG